MKKNLAIGLIAIFVAVTMVGAHSQTASAQMYYQNSSYTSQYGYPYYYGQYQYNYYPTQCYSGSYYYPCNNYSNYYYYPYYYPYYNYNYYPYNQYYQQLTLTCSPSTYSTNVNGYVTWTAYVSGGSNSQYNFNWSGEGISTYNPSIQSNVYSYSGGSNYVSAYYTTPGQKTATVTVTSGGQTISRNCGTVTVNGYYPWYRWY
ncbi:MAG: hypothetical protein KGJ35_00665 [Patescibacteria group bacterium]|nr:hypothetical protein [Patescibacteria group bacterium]